MFNYRYHLPPASSHLSIFRSPTVSTFSAPILCVITGLDFFPSLHQSSSPPERSRGQSPLDSCPKFQLIHLFGKSGILAKSDGIKFLGEIGSIPSLFQPVASINREESVAASDREAITETTNRRTEQAKTEQEIEGTESLLYQRASNNGGHEQEHKQQAEERMG